MPEGSNPEAVTLPANTEDDPVAGADLHPGDTTHPDGTWIHVDDEVRKVAGGLVHWGNGHFRPTALPHLWHVNAAGNVEVGR